MQFGTLARFAAVAAIVALSACGGGKSSTTQSVTTGASTAPMTEGQKESSNMPAGQAAAMPASLNCGDVKPVWVNTNSHAYHESDSPYYGRTKNGKYMCPSQAAAEGDHPAGQAKSQMNSTQGSMKHHRYGQPTSSP